MSDSAAQPEIAQAPPARRPSLRRHRPLWRNLDFTLMWTSTAASGFGDRMIMLGALALIGGMAADVESTSRQAATQFWFFIAYFFFSIPGGWLADRLPRKWIMLGCDEARGLLLLGSMLMVTAATGAAEIPAEYHGRVFAILFAVGACAAVFNPARSAIVPQIVPANQLQPANAIVLSINVIASMIGLLVGGMIIDVADGATVGNGLLLGAAFYMVSGTFFAFLRPHHHDFRVEAAEDAVDRRPSPGSDTAASTTRSGADAAARRSRGNLEAVRFILRHRRIMVLVLMTLVVWPVAAAVTSGLMGLGKVRLGLVDQPLLDYFTRASACMGVGMLLGAAVISAIRTRRESRLVLTASLAMAGLSLLLLTFAPTVSLSYAAALLVGVCGNVAIVSIITILQSISPNYIRGRIMGLTAWLNTLGSAVTYWLIWQLPNADEVILGVMIALGLGLAVIGIAGLVSSLIKGPTPDRGLNALWHLARLYAYGWHGLEVRGKQHLPTFEPDAPADDPRRQPVLLAANHTTGIDGFVIQPPWQRIIRWVMLKSYLFGFAKPLWRRIRPIALDQHDNGEAKADRANLKLMIDALREGQPVGIFPEGRLQRDVRQLGELREGTAFVARRSGAMIIPVWIHGTPPVKSMLLHFLMPSSTVVVFGEPFTPGRHDDDAATMAELRRRLLALGETFDKPAPGPGPEPAESSR